MRRLSSKWTLWYKRGVPTAWLSFLALLLYCSVFGTRTSVWSVPLGFLCVGFVAVVGFIVCRELNRLADGVFEDDDGLVVFNRGEALRIAYRNIVQFHEKSPSYVVVTFTPEGGESDEFCFLPECTWGQVWRRNRVVEGLALKVMRARRET